MKTLSERVAALDHKPGVQTEADRLAKQVAKLEADGNKLARALRSLMSAEGDEPGCDEQREAWDYAADALGEWSGCVTPSDGWGWTRLKKKRG